jgi:hypothetical protein
LPPVSGHECCVLTKRGVRRGRQSRRRPRARLGLSRSSQ